MTSTPPPSSSSATVRPMSVLAAVGWAFGVQLLDSLIVSAAVALRPGAKFDLVTRFFGQLIAYWLGLFAILRFYAPNVSIRQFLAVRHTSVALYPLAFLAGFAIQFPAEALFQLVLARWPVEGLEETIALVHSAPPLRRVVLAILLAVMAPIVEESFFRGALFTPLRRFAPDPDRAIVEPTLAASYKVTIVTTSLFVMIHSPWQLAVGILGPAILLGFVRLRSGSIIPGVLLHIGFNPMPVVASARTLPEVIPTWWTVAGSVVTVASIAAIYFVTRDEATAAARADEL